VNKLSTADRCRVLACLVEGNSQRATVRMTGIAPGLTQYAYFHTLKPDAWRWACAFILASQQESERRWRKGD